VARKQSAWVLSAGTANQPGLLRYEGNCQSANTYQIMTQLTVVALIWMYKIVKLWYQGILFCFYYPVARWCHIRTKQVWMCYRSGTGRRCIGDKNTLWSQWPGGSTFLCEITSCPPFWKYDIKSKTRLCQSMCICAKNIPAKFHPNPTWNNGALGFFE